MNPKSALGRRYYCDPFSEGLYNIILCSCLLMMLTLAMLNKLRCHAHFSFSANQITWSRLLIQIHILSGKQCGSRSVGFFRNNLLPMEWIWFHKGPDVQESKQEITKSPLWKWHKVYQVFFPLAVLQWNRLPPNVVLPPTLNEFSVAVRSLDHQNALTTTDLILNWF